MLIPSENLQSSNLLAKLKDFNSITSLQLEKCYLPQARLLFDRVIAENVDVIKYIPEQSDIVYSPEFESGLLDALSSVLVKQMCQWM